MNIKKKLLTLILLLCVFFPCLTFVSACGEPQPIEPDYVGWEIVSEDDNFPEDVEIGSIIIKTPEDFIKFVDHINGATGTLIRGESADQYKINIKESGQTLDANGILTASYVLGGDIDLSDKLEEPLNSIGSYMSRYYNERDKKENGLEYSAQRAFNGTFNGNGYKISNFTMLGGARGFDWTEGSYNYVVHRFAYANGFFATLGSSAVIQNLWLDSYQIILNENQVEPGTAGSGYYQSERNALIVGGGICGFAMQGAQIKCCKVSDLSVGYVRYDVGEGLTKTNSLDCGVSGICGMGKIHVENCEIDDFIVIEKEYDRYEPSFNFNVSKSDYDIDHITVKPFTTAFDKISLSDKDSWNFYGHGAGWEAGLSEVRNVVGQNISLLRTDISLESYGSYATIPGYQTKSGNFTISQDYYTTNLSSNKPWYYAENYNNGFLTLRQFIRDFDTIMFKTDYQDLVKFEFSSDGEMVNSNSILIPSIEKTELGDVELTKLENENTFTTNIYGYDVKVKLENDFFDKAYKCKFIYGYDNENRIHFFEPIFTIMASSVELKPWAYGDGYIDISLYRESHIETTTQKVNGTNSECIWYEVEDFVVTNSYIYLGENIDEDKFKQNNDYQNKFITHYNENSKITSDSEFKLICNIYQNKFDLEKKEITRKSIYSQEYNFKAGNKLQSTYKSEDILTSGSTNKSEYIVKISPKIELDGNVNAGENKPLTIQLNVFNQRIWSNGDVEDVKIGGVNPEDFTAEIWPGYKFQIKTVGELLNYYRFIKPGDETKEFTTNTLFIGQLVKVLIDTTDNDTYEDAQTYTSFLEITDFELTENTIILVYVSLTDVLGMNNQEIQIYEDGHNNAPIITTIPSSQTYTGKYPVYIRGEGLVITDIENNIGSVSIGESKNGNTLIFTIKGKFTGTFAGVSSILVIYDYDANYTLSSEDLFISIEGTILKIQPKYEADASYVFYNNPIKIDGSDILPADLKNVKYESPLTLSDFGTAYRGVFNKAYTLIGYKVQSADSIGNIITMDEGDSIDNYFTISDIEYPDIDEDGEQDERSNIIKSFGKITLLKRSVIITPIYDDMYYEVTINYIPAYAEVISTTVAEGDVDVETGSIKLKVKHGESLLPYINADKTQFEFESWNKVVFKAKTGYVYSYFIIEEGANNGTPKELNPVEDGFGNKCYTLGIDVITGDMEISLVFELKKYEVRFVQIDESAAELTNKAETKLSVVSEMIQRGKSITVEFNDTFTIVMFKLDESVIAKYTAKPGYTYRTYIILSEGKSSLDIIESDIEIYVLFDTESGIIAMSLNYGKDDNNKSSIQMITADYGTNVTFSYITEGNKNTANIYNDNLKETFELKAGESVLSYTTANNNNEKWEFSYAIVNEKYQFIAQNGILKYKDRTVENLQYKNYESNDLFTLSDSLNSITVNVYFVRIIEVEFNDEIINAEGLKNISNYTPEEFDFSSVEGSKYILEIRSNGQGLTRNDGTYVMGSTSTLTFGVSKSVSVQGLEKLKEYEIDRYYLSCGWLISLDEDDVNKTSRNTSVYDLPDMNDVGRKITITPIVHLNAIKFVLSYDSDALDTNKLEQQEGMVEGIDKIVLDENNSPLKATIYFEFETIIQYNHTKKSSNYVLIELMISYSSVGNENYKCFEIELKTKSAQNGVSGLCGATEDEVEAKRLAYNYCVLNEKMENYVLNFSIEFGPY